MKPIHAKPNIYAYFFEGLKPIALGYGYNLVVHGSMNRDLDLIAVPWVDDPKPEIELIEALNKYLGGRIMITPNGVPDRLPGGRHSYVINLNRGGYKRNELDEIAEALEYIEDPQYYIDISVTPLVK